MRLASIQDALLYNVDSSCVSGFTCAGVVKVVLVTTSPHLSTVSSLTLCGILQVTVCAKRPERVRVVMIRSVSMDTKQVAQEVLEELDFLAMIWHTPSVGVSSRSFGTVSRTGLRCLIRESVKAGLWIICGELKAIYLRQFKIDPRKS